MPDDEGEGEMVDMAPGETWDKSRRWGYIICGIVSGVLLVLLVKKSTS